MRSTPPNGERTRYVRSWQTARSTPPTVRDGTLLRSDFEPGQLAGEAWYAAREPVVPLLVLNDAFAAVVETPRLPAGSYVLNGPGERASRMAGHQPVICSMANDAAQNLHVDER